MEYKLFVCVVRAYNKPDQDLINVRSIEYQGFANSAKEMEDRVSMKWQSENPDFDYLDFEVNAYEVDTRLMAMALRERA